MELSKNMLNINYIRKMDEIFKKLKELYDVNPTLFGFLLFLDLLIIFFNY